MSQYNGWLFRSPKERLENFAGMAKQHAPANTRRILDIGCGNGVLLSELCKLFPEAELVGIDISSPNILLAKETYKAPNMSFVEDDYLKSRTQSHDLIVSYSTINLIPISAEDILKKVSGDLSISGIFIASMPYECTYNMMLIAFRKILGLFRSKITDRMIYIFGRLITPSNTPDSLIVQNIGYMYIVPTHLDGKKFRKIAMDAGLVFIKSEDEAKSSIAKLKHRVVVFKKG